MASSSYWQGIYVAPYVGAWIETSIRLPFSEFQNVAPYVGAWIETFKYRKILCNGDVSPYVGAWIETDIKVSTRQLVRSHPTWVRGLKLKLRPILNVLVLSHPTWVRGLKHLQLPPCP